MHSPIIYAVHTPKDSKPLTANQINKIKDDIVNSISDTELSFVAPELDYCTMITDEDDEQMNRKSIVKPQISTQGEIQVENEHSITIKTSAKYGKEQINNLLDKKEKYIQLQRELLAKGIYPIKSWSPEIKELSTDDQAIIEDGVTREESIGGPIYVVIKFSDNGRLVNIETFKDFEFKDGTNTSALNENGIELQVITDFTGDYYY